MEPRSHTPEFLPGRRLWWRRRIVAAVLLTATGAGLALAMQPAVESSDRGETGASDELILLPDMLSWRRNMRAQREMEVVMRAAVRKHPELIDSPRRDGFYRLDIALNPDGSVYRSGVAYYQGDRNNGTYVNSFDTWRIIPRAASSRAEAVIQRGESVSGVGIAPNTIEINYGFLPVNYDPSRAAERVEVEVRRQHADLIQPYRNGIVNVLTVLLTEDGSIARTHVVPKNIKQDREWVLRPDFSVMGLDPEQLGPSGTFVMPRDPVDTTTPASFHIFPDRDKDKSEEGILWVRYAWPRRIGEPAGGPPLSYVNLIPELQAPTIAERLVSRYCPNALTPREQPSGWCWIVFTREGRVLRTGLYEANEDRSFGSELIRSLNPDLNLAVVKSEWIGNRASDKHAQLLLAWVGLDSRTDPESR